MYDYVNKEYIKNHNFKFDGLNFEEKRENASYMLAPDAPLPMSNEKKAIILVKKLNDIIGKKFEFQFNAIEARCSISESLMRKCLKMQRNVTRDLLAKFCVGAGLDLAEADELFMLQGYRLDPENNLLDAIVVDALKCGDDICVFYEECESFNLKVFK